MKTTEISTITEVLLSKYKRRDSVPVEIRDKLDRLDSLKAQITDDVTNLEANRPHETAATAAVRDRMEAVGSALGDLQLRLEARSGAEAETEAEEEAVRLKTELAALSKAVRQKGAGDARQALSEQLRMMEDKMAAVEQRLQEQKANDEEVNFIDVKFCFRCAFRFSLLVTLKKDCQYNDDN